jgi:hypothetical protein
MAIRCEVCYEHPRIGIHMHTQQQDCALGRPDQGRVCRLVVLAGCLWAPLVGSQQAQDAFGYEACRRHLTIKELARADGPPSRDTAAARCRRQEAQRKRQARRQAADQLRADILGRAAIDDDMPAQGRRLLDIHLTIAGQRGARAGQMSVGARQRSLWAAGYD